MIRARFLLPLLAGSLLVAIPPRAATAAHEWFAQEPPLLSLSTGLGGVLDDDQEIFWGVEYRPAFRFYRFGPWLFFGTGKSAEFYAAVGVLLNLQLGRGWVLTPSFGGGYYSAQEGLDLGFDAEFRSSIEIAKRLANEQRISLGFAHLSNGALSDRNPGTETLFLTYSFPLDFLFPRPSASSTPTE